MSQTKKKPTLQDVADAAGVSIATVSRAINNKESVKEGTYDRSYRRSMRSVTTRLFATKAT